MFSPGVSPVVPPMVSAFTRAFGFVSEAVDISAPVSAIIEAADTAFYYPVLLPSSCVVRRVWWANGVAGSTYTVEVGVYDDANKQPGAKIVSGSAAQGDANSVQFVDVTDTAIPPGLYWIAIRTNDASDTKLFRSVSSLAVDASMRMKQASASPLPSTATPVETDTSPNIYLCGFATTATP